MPCTDGGVPYDYDDGTRRRLQQTESMLCAALTVLEKNGLMKNIDHKEAGVSSTSMAHWWSNHKEQDARRREREKRLAQEKAEKARILAKLTPVERKKLGL